MNCKELAAHLTHAERRNIALAHVEHCPVCAARLAELDPLTAAFRAIRTSDATKQAPERLESHLLTAYRQQPAKVTAMPLPRTASVPRWNRWLLAAAAIVIAVCLALFSFPLESHPRAAEQAYSGMPNLSIQIKPVAPQTVAPAQNSVVAGVPKERSITIPRTRNVSYQALGKPKPSPSNINTRSKGDSTTRREIATDFLPLPIGYSLPMTEGGQVMRVQLPRTALSSFGLPVDFNRASELIKADVVVGNDGIARAIRFVR